MPQHANQTTFKKGMIPWNKRYFNKVCIDCGKPVKREGKRCMACYRGRGSVETPCAICGKITRHYKSDIKKSSHLFCSSKCYGKFYLGRTPWNKGLDGGSEYNYTEFNMVLKDMIRKRDGFKCQICGVPQTECMKKLHIHHIDYNKRNNLPSNLISLCHSCHTRTNGKRDYWREVCHSLRNA